MAGERPKLGSKRKPKVILGWHEWVAFPGLGITRIAAKMDTGARTSSLHARDIVAIRDPEDGLLYAEFTAPLLRHQADPEVWPAGGLRRVRAPLIDERLVRSSNGKEEPRWVVLVEFSFDDILFQSELTLADRTGMQFPVLIGRQALKGRFLVNAGRSHLLAKRARKRLSTDTVDPNDGHAGAGSD